MKDDSTSKSSSETNASRQTYDEAIVRTMPFAAFAMDNEGKVVQFNEAAARLTGIEMAEAIGMRVRDVFNQTLGKKDCPVMGAVKSGKSLSLANIKLLVKDDEEVEMTLDASPLLDPSQKVIGGYVILTPCKVDKASEEKIYLYEQIMDSLPWPLSVTDSKMNWTFINKPVEQLLGVKRTDMLGKQCSNWNANICRTQNCGITCLREGKCQTTFEQQGLNFQVDTAYIKGHTGENIGHIEIVQDITQKIKADRYRAFGVKKFMDCLKQVAHGDMNIDITLPTPDKDTQVQFEMYTAILADISVLRDTVMSMIDDINYMSEEHHKGNVDVLIPVEKYQGAFKDMAVSLNMMLGEYTSLTSKVLGCISEFGKGNFDATLERFPGKRIVINNTIEQVRSNLKALLSDAEMLVTSAMDGRLDTRVDASKHQGGFRMIVDGVNKTLDSLVGNFEAIPTPIQFMDKDLRFTYINETGAKLLGKSKKELMGQKCADLWKTSKCNTPECPCATAMRNNSIHTCENDCMVGGNHLDIFCAGAPLHDAAGKIIGSFEFVTDQSEVKRAIRKAEKVSGFQSKAVTAIKRDLETMATGDLTTSVDHDEKVKGFALMRADEDLKEVVDTFDALYGSIYQFKGSVVELLKEVNGSVDLVSSTSQELASSAEEMNASTEQVSAAIQQISKGAQSQAAQVDDTAKVMAEIAGSLDIVTGKSVSATEAAKKANESANAGKGAVDNTVKKMQEIAKVVDESAKVIETLGKRSEEIGEIVNVITGISEQTNLLALNAAIEAARAGEQGRGFAVVAEEVKNLAEDSREAAERIAKMIKEVQIETNKAVEAMKVGTKTTAEGIAMVDETGKAFGEISLMVSTTSNEVDSISSMMMKQKEGTQTAAKAVDGIASIAEETASASEESASSTEELTASMEDMTARAQSLSEMAINLKKVAGRFKYDGGMNVAAEPQAVPIKAAVKSPVKDTGARGNAPKVPEKVKDALSKRGIPTPA